MQGLSESHIHSLVRRLRQAVVLGVLGFAVLGAPPRAEAACLPAPTWVNGPVGTVSDPQPTFSWGAVPGATSYTLYILGAADDGAIVVRQTGITGTTFHPPSPLPGNQDLRWKVKGEGPCGAGLYASGQVFRIGASCPPNSAVATLYFPEGTIHDPAPTFCWSPVPGAPEYVIALLYAADDGGYVLGHAVTTSETCINLGPLPINTPMRWKIKTECNEQYGDFTNSMYFTIVK